MTNTRLLNANITISGLTREKIAEKLDISLNSLGKKINNKVEFKASEIYKLSKLLNIENKDSIFFADSVD